MKIIIFFFAAFVCMTSAAPSTKSLALARELKEFVNLLPKEEMTEIFYEYLARDAEIQSIMAFLTSDNYATYMLDLESVPEYQTELKFLQNAGVDIFGFLEVLHESMDMPPYVRPTTRASRLRGINQGMQGLIIDWQVIMPWNSIRMLSEKKLQTSSLYRNFYNLMHGDEFRQLFCACDASEHFQRVLAFARQFGYDPYLIGEFNLQIFNIKFVRC